MIQITIRGIQAAQAANLKNIAAVKPSGALGKAVKHGATLAHRHAVSVTHVDTGALRASHRIDLDKINSGSATARVYIDPASRGKGGKSPAVYGYYEHRRGGDHAFYERTVNERGDAIAKEAGVFITKAVN